MKNIWKWVLGIILVLVVVAALVAVPFVMRNYMATNFVQPNVQNTTPANPANPTNPQNRAFNGPMMRGFNQQGRGPNGFNGPMMRGGRNFQRGFMPFGGFGPFGFGFMFLGGLLRLLPLVLFGLLLFGAYQLGKRAGVHSVQVAAVPVASTVIPAEPSTADENETPEI